MLSRKKLTSVLERHGISCPPVEEDPELLGEKTPRTAERAPATVESAFVEALRLRRGEEPFAGLSVSREEAAARRAVFLSVRRLALEKELAALDPALLSEPEEKEDRRGEHGEEE